MAPTPDRGCPVSKSGRTRMGLPAGLRAAAALLRPDPDLCMDLRDHARGSAQDQRNRCRRIDRARHWPQDQCADHRPPGTGHRRPAPRPADPRRSAVESARIPAKPVAAGAASKPATGEAETESTAIVRTAAGKFLEHAQPSIAVLPFDTRSDDRQDEYFSAGIHDDLLTQLAKIDGLKVISRTSVMQYADSTKPMKQIAAELGVATVLEGGVQRSGSRIRVNAQLIEARTDNHLWAETYDEELSASNIFSIQSRLATSIAGALKAELAPGVQERIDSQPTESLEGRSSSSRGRSRRIPVTRRPGPVSRRRSTNWSAGPTGRTIACRRPGRPPNGRSNSTRFWPKDFSPAVTCCAWSGDIPRVRLRSSRGCP